MGLNINLKKMFAIPAPCCVKCGYQQGLASTLTDFDIEGNEPQNGKLIYHDTCTKCGTEQIITVTFHPISDSKAALKS